MRRIPKQYALLGHTIKVRKLSPRDWDAISDEYDIEDAVGFFSPSDQVVLVKHTTPSMELHTFYHELTHSILSTMNHKLNDDEEFVDNFAGLLAQAMQTAK